MHESDEIDLTGSSILIVDDQPLSIKLMEALLNQKGFKTSSAPSGQEALKYLEEHTPDLVMLDVMMPGMSGFEVSRKIRQKSETADIPVIFVTARDDAETIAQCFDAGGTDYASKPLRIYELLARVKLALTASRHKLRAKISEEALEENKSFLKGIIDENPAQIFVMNHEGRFLTCNQKFAETLKISPEKTNGLTIEELSANGIKTNNIRRLTKDSGLVLREGKTRHSFEMAFRDSEGNERWLMCTRVPFIYQQDECVLGINLDFTDLKMSELENRKLESQLAQSQKMEVIGTLAGGIAHDFNNMLAVILGYADLAKNTLPEEAKQRKHLTEVIKAGTRAKDLVKQILNFSRQSEVQYVTFSVTDIIKEIAKMIVTTLPSNISSELNAGKEEYFVSGDQTQIHQVFMNLCVNANQAMPDGGSLKMALSKGTYESCSCCNHTLDGIYVLATIEDSGMGMSDAVAARIFEPFYTTKDIGEGTGMGLAVVHGIIKQHKGHICVKSTENKGTKFNVYLPAVSEIEHQESEDVFNDYSGSGNILVIDDEKMVANLITDTLEASGYTIKTFNDSKEALKEFEASHDNYDLILTDYMMPGMNGAQLAEKIRSIDPKIPIIMATGYSNDVTSKDTQKIGIDLFLMKPIIGEELCKSIKEILIPKHKL